METSAPIKTDSNRKSSFDTLIVCLSLCVPAICFGKTNALMMILTCLLTVTASEFVFMKLICKKNLWDDFSFVSSALTIALLLPSDAPFYVGIAASFFSVAVSVFPFGSRLNTPFVPSAVGIAFAVTAFKNELSYGKDLSSLISEGEVFNLDFFSVTDILSGALPGAMGCTSILTLSAVAVYLLIRKKDRLIPSSGFILSAAVFAFIFPRVNAGRLTSVFLEICSGSLLFAALLLINHPITAPQKKLHGFIYGICAGIITMLLRHFSPVLMPEVFTILIMNAVLPSLTGETVNRKKTERKERTAYETKLS